MLWRQTIFSKYGCNSISHLHGFLQCDSGPSIKKWGLHILFSYIWAGLWLPCSQESVVEVMLLKVGQKRCSFCLIHWITLEAWANHEKSLTTLRLPHCEEGKATGTAWTRAQAGSHSFCNLKAQTRHEWMHFPIIPRPLKIRRASYLSICSPKTYYLSKNINKLIPKRKKQQS